MMNLYVIYQMKKGERAFGTFWHPKEKKLGDPLDILGSYIFHSDNSFPKFLTQNFSVVALLREKK